MQVLNIKKKIFSSSRISFFILLFICFASAILGDSVAEALLLSHFDASVIPRMYMVNALFLFLFSLFIMSLIDRIDRGLFFLVFMLVHCIVLVLIWCAVFFGMTFLFIPLFSYAYVTKIFLFLMFWTLANDVIDSRKAGEQFPFIAAGGTLGAIGISFMIPWLLKLISAQSLLLVWIALCALVLVCFIPLKKSFGKYFMQISDSEKHMKRNLKSLMTDVALIGREPLLANMSLLYFMLFFILLNQHYAFYEAIKARFMAADRLAGFLGYFNGISMGATFFLQLTLAGIVIKKIGSTRSMFMLPAVLCIVFGALTVLGFTAGSDEKAFAVSAILFWGIVGGVGMRIAFFDSFFSPNFQIFFSSLPQDVRGRGKLVIEGVIKPSAMVFASLWLLLVTSNISFGTNMIILLGISVVMIIQTFRIRASYTESLAQYLGDFKSRVSLSLFDSAEILASDSMLAFLSQKLESESYEIKCYVIEILAKINTEASIKILTDTLYKEEKRVRATIVSSLTKNKSESLKSLFKMLLMDADERVVANSIFALAAYNDRDINEGLQAFLNHRNNRVRANTIIALWPVSGKVYRKKLCAVLEEMLSSEEQNVCASALFVLREIAAEDEGTILLTQFYNNNTERLLRERMLWSRFLRAVAVIPVDSIIESLLTRAGTISKKMRKDIVSALTEACANRYSTDRLVMKLALPDTVVRGIILKVLLALKQDERKKYETTLIKIAGEEAQHAFKDWVSYNMLVKRTDNSAEQLLSNAIQEECITDHLNNLIVIAAMLDTSGQVKAVMRRLNHENRHVRARALEVLDNIGNMKVNRLVIKLIEAADLRGMLKEGQAQQPPVEHEILTRVKEYVNNTNSWVRVCARYALTQYGAV